MNASISNRRGRRSPQADATRRAEVDRERATRAFLGDDATPDLDNGDLFDLADDASDALPNTANVRGYRAVEEP